MIFKRGVFKFLKEGVARVFFNDMESRDIERVEPFGFSSHPKEGQAHILFVNGEKSNGVVFMVEGDKVELDKGEVMVYSDKDNYIKLKKEETEIKRGELVFSIKDNKLKINNATSDFSEIFADLLKLIKEHKTVTMLGASPMSPEEIVKVANLEIKVKGLLQ